MRGKTGTVSENQECVPLCRTIRRKRREAAPNRGKRQRSDPLHANRQGWIVSIRQTQERNRVLSRIYGEIENHLIGGKL